MLTRRTWILCAIATPFACSALGCSKDEPSSKDAGTTASGLAPTDPVDPAFEGCRGSCGSRSAKDRREARTQPGAGPGDAVFCPVSGAVFRISDTTQKRESHGKTLYFCCQACAVWFSEHEADVLTKRGIG
jgi:YHS domain-containing protein